MATMEPGWCRNRRCGERLTVGQHVFCASCWAAGRWGAVAAFVVVAVTRTLWAFVGW